MPAEVANDAGESRPYANGDLKSQNPSNTAAKKSRETERRRRRQKQKKNNKASQASDAGDGSDTAAEDGTADDSSKENSDPQKEVEVNLVTTDYCMPEMTGYDLL